MLKPEHYKEWQDSCVDRALIDLNVESLAGDAVYEFLLYGLDRSDRRNDGRLRDNWLNKYEPLSKGGWWCFSLELPDFERGQWGCFKPDKPRSEYEKKKAIKYEHPPKVETRAFILDVPKTVWGKISARWGIERSGTNFWQWVIENHQLPLIITEGAKKAGCLLSAGYPAIALPGIWNGCKGDDKLIPELEIFCSKWRQISFAFDSDPKWKTLQAVQSAILKIGKLIQELGSEVFINQWRHTDGKGIDDLIASQGADTWEAVYERRLSFSEFEIGKRKKKLRFDMGQLMDFVEIEFKSRLSFNTLYSKLLLDGQYLDTEGLQGWLCQEYEFQCTKEICTDVFIYYAKQKMFNPVVQYLHSVEKTATRINIDNLATRYFGVNDSLYDLFVRRWLIGAIARALEPGCKNDTALLLQGNQGIKKSTFFQVLGGDWYDDTLSDLGSKDSLMQLHSCWIQELGEFDKISSKRAAAEIKAVLSRKIDNFRKPYGHEIQTHPRRSVICGTVNKHSFLLDETGSRRFWVIPVSEKIESINIKHLAEERDGIWASAIDAYRAGEIWWLTREEDLLSQEYNSRFEVTDEWESEIENYINGKTEITVKDILHSKFNLAPVDQDKATQMRVCQILTKLGWQKTGRKIVNGKRTIVWESAIEQKQQKQNFLRGCSSVPGVPLNTNELYNNCNGNSVLINTLKGVPLSESETGQGVYPPPQEKWNTGTPPQKVLENFFGEISKYDYPPDGFQSGDIVEWDGKRYTVENSSHTHTSLKGVKYAIANWQLKKV